MDNKLERRRAWMGAGVSLLLIAVAAIAYTLGAQHEAVQAGADTGRVVYYRHGPWGFGWILLLFWIFGGFRWMLWGPRWGHRRYYRGWYDARDEWEAWHRREHERMQGAPPPDRRNEPADDRHTP